MLFRNNDGGLYGKISMKSKVIIACILVCVVIGIAYREALNSRKSNNIIESVNKENSSNNAVIKEKKDDSVSKQAEAEKAKEQKYNESYKAFGEKKYDDTITSADEIIKEDPSFYKAYNIKGIALCYKGDFQEGMKNIDKALQLKPDFGYARFNKALAYELHGDYDEALTWYDKNLEVENYIWSYYGKASIYGRRGDTENTVKYLKIAVSMSPDIKNTAAKEEDFNPVKDSKEFQDIIK
jgi:tetratricopeptide (TPR) repeat protein